MTKRLTGLGLSWIFIGLIVSLGGCFSSSAGSNKTDSATLTTWQGVTVSRETRALNGLYEGQVDQVNGSTWLIMDGNIIGHDASYGYRGYINFTEQDQEFIAQVMRYPLTIDTFQSKLLIASGNAILQQWQGLRFTPQSGNVTLVADYAMPDYQGSLVLNDTGALTFPSQMNQLLDQWQSGDHRIYITSLEHQAGFHGFNPQQAGCHYQGSIKALAEHHSVFAINQSEQQLCEGFNGVNADGYALIGSNGDFHWFLQRGNELLFQQFARVTTTSTNTGDESGSGDSSDNAGDSTDDSSGVNSGVNSGDGISEDTTESRE